MTAFQKRTDRTVVEAFPIPYPNEYASNHLATARLLLDTVMISMERGEDLSSSVVQSLFNVQFRAMEILDVIQLFLDDLKAENELLQYQSARRLWVMQKGGAA